MNTTIRAKAFKYCWYVGCTGLVVSILTREVNYVASCIAFLFFVLYLEPVTSYFCEDEEIVFPWGIKRANDNAHWHVLISITMLCMVAFMAFKTLFFE